MIYERFRRDLHGLGEFQNSVHRLQEMERLGLIGKLFVEKRIRPGSERVDFVMIQGGLTLEGRRLLAESSAELLSA